MYRAMMNLEKITLKGYSYMTCGAYNKIYIDAEKKRILRISNENRYYDFEEYYIYNQLYLHFTSDHIPSPFLENTLYRCNQRFCSTMPFVKNTLKDYLRIAESDPDTFSTKLITVLDKAYEILRELFKNYDFVHGDLRIENILITDEIQLYLIDCGYTKCKINSELFIATNISIAELDYQLYNEFKDIFTLMYSIWWNSGYVDIGKTLNTFFDKYFQMKSDHFETLFELFNFMKEKK